MKAKRSIYLFALLLAISTIGCQQNTPEPLYKGNLHTHSYWSDGNTYPEEVARWYRDQGYHFLVVTDHNMMQEGLKKKVINGDTVILKTLADYRGEFEKPGEFILLSGEELSDASEKKPVHLNGIGLTTVVNPVRLPTVVETLAADVEALRKALEPVGLTDWVIVNHPNFGWALTTEALAQCGTRFVEVFNGHPGVRNYGDSAHISVELMWDRANKWRVDNGQPLILGVATDDTHNYDIFKVGKANPGRGWVMVRATSLTPEALYQAMYNGDFYASTGVQLEQFGFTKKKIDIRIRPEEGVKYTTEFIGWLPGNPDPEMLKSVEGIHAVYQAKGNELFVRARIISDKLKDNPFKEGDQETAWLQPVSFRRF